MVKLKKYVLPAAGIKTKTAPHNAGSRDCFRFAGLLPIGAGSAKRNDGPQCPPQAKKIWDLGGVLYKKHEPPGGSAPAADGNFLAIWGALYTKITLLGCIQERVSDAKHPPKSSKFSASGGPNPQMFENTPPPCCKIGNNKGEGGGGSTISVDTQIFSQLQILNGGY